LGPAPLLQRRDPLLVARARAVIHSRDSWGEPVTSDTTMFARMGAHPSGTIYARVNRVTGNGTVPCESGTVTFTLRRSR
jgi:hypothetical protein